MSRGLARRRRGRMLSGKPRAMSTLAAHAPWLWCFTVLFFLRVAGQGGVVLFHPRWLPPMEQWYSGLMPYPYLLPSQILILGLLVAIDRDVSAGAGLFARPRPLLGRGGRGVSYLYASGMVARYGGRGEGGADPR